MSLSREIRYTEDVGRVKNVQFGILSPERILKQSVCEITKSYRHQDDITSNNKYGTLHDPRMGTNDRAIKNPLSKLTVKYDPGHFGHINLPKPIMPVHFMEFIIKVLNAVCFRCSAIRIEKTEKQINEIKKRKRQKRMEYIDPIVKRQKVCPICKADLPGVREMKNAISSIEVVNGGDCPKFEKSSILNAEMVLRIFKLINDEDCELIGYDPVLSRPEWMVWTVFPVPPLSMRPSIKDETTGKSDDDDLTIKLNDILKSCEELRNLLGNEKENVSDKTDMSNRISEWWNCLTYHVSTYIDNDERNGNTLSNGMPTSKSRNGRQLKTLRSRIKSKNGHIRQNLMGKRVDHSARTVITGDPNMSINELGVPVDIANNLAYPETVNKYNIGYLNNLLQRGKVKWIIENTKINPQTIDVEFLRKSGKQPKPIKEGNIVWRYLQDGDIVFFNRQPTLHRMSMMAHKAVILEGKSFRLNGSCTSPYAADFDGDEMNMHVPISEACRYELEHLTIVSTQIVSPQGSKPVIGLIQDSLLAWHLITKRNNNIPLSVFMDIKGLWVDSNISSTKTDTIDLGTHDFISNVLPNITLFKKGDSFSEEDLTDETINSEYIKICRRFGNKLENINQKAKIKKIKELKNKSAIIVENGNYKSGIFDTKQLGKGANGGLIHATWKDCGHLRTQKFIDTLNKVATNWLLYEGFSVGLKDMRIYNKKSEEEIENAVLKGFKESEQLIQRLYTGEIKALVTNSVRMQFEKDIATKLQNVRTVADSITNNAIELDNRMDMMITAGSKGSKNNTISIISMLGQQNIDGIRIQDTMDHRPLPFFEKDAVHPVARRFIRNSHYSGLNPVEYLYHAMEGRLGVISTAINTAETGYIHRKLIKVMEDLKVYYDGTVRNAHNVVIQPMYGYDGFDGSKIEKQELFNDENEFDTIYIASEDDYEKFMTEEAYESINETNKIVLQDEISWLKVDMIYCKTNHISYVESPVNYNRIIKDVIHKYNLKNMKKCTISTVDIVNKVNSLFDYLIMDDYKEINEIIQRGFKVLTRQRLASKILMKHKFNQEALEYLIEQIKFMYIDSVINPGELVGIIAAQSIGEPCTQLTLDSFHNTGLSKGTNVAGGIPRIKELMENSKDMRTPSVNIVVKKQVYEMIESSNIKESNVLIQKKIQDIANYISQVKLVDIIDKNYDIETFYDISDKNSVEQQDQTMLSEFYKYYEIVTGNEYIQVPNNIVIRFVLDNYKMYTNNFLTGEIKYAIESKYPNYQVIISNDNANNVVLRVRTDQTDTRKVTRQIKDVIIRGVSKINRVVVQSEKSKDNNNWLIDDEWLIQTEGTNLATILTINEVDKYKTLSNKVEEVYELFGVEAARAVLLNEIYNVLKNNATISMRHLELLCDSMTYRGYIISVSIHGVKKIDSGPLARASFEESTNELTKAAVYHENDNMNGVSANVMFGQYLKAGTTDFELLLDENMVLNNEYEESYEEEVADVDFIYEEIVDEYCQEDNFDLTFDF